jgi:hypothetical protein
MVRWNTLAGELKMAMSDNGELMALSGFINPYPGRLGVVEEGTVADLVLVDGNPLGNIKLMKGRVQSRLSHVPTVAAKLPPAKCVGFIVRSGLPQPGA